MSTPYACKQDLGFHLQRLSLLYQQMTICSPIVGLLCMYRMKRGLMVLFWLMGALSGHMFSALYKMHNCYAVTLLISSFLHIKLQIKHDRLCMLTMHGNKKCSSSEKFFTQHTLARSATHYFCNLLVSSASVKQLHFSKKKKMNTHEDATFLSDESSCTFLGQAHVPLAWYQRTR